tara:strand:+ start:734 stop:1084 length:351 start_codon:yes stop_codon:yes gene_type:complete
MFGFSLKEKTIKLLEDEIGHFNPTKKWLDHIIKIGKPQEFNEYDVAINYLMTEWEFKINQCKDNPDMFGKEIRKSWYKTINQERKKFAKIEHLAHQDLDFRDRSARIIKNSKSLIK